MNYSSFEQNSDGTITAYVVGADTRFPPFVDAGLEFVQSLGWNGESGDDSESMSLHRIASSDAGFDLAAAMGWRAPLRQDASPRVRLAQLCADVAPRSDLSSYWYELHMGRFARTLDSLRGMAVLVSNKYGIVKVCDACHVLAIDDAFLAPSARLYRFRDMADLLRYNADGAPGLEELPHRL